LPPESSRIDQENLITALGLLGEGHPEVIETLLNFSLGSYPSTFLLEAVAQALGELGDEQPRATAKLFDFLPDSSLSALNSGVSVSAQQIAIEALGRTSNKEQKPLQDCSIFFPTPIRKYERALSKLLGSWVTDNQKSQLICRTPLQYWS